MKDLFKNSKMNANVATIILILFAVFSSSCSSTSPIGRASAAIANAFHNPVYEDTVVGTEYVTTEKIVGYETTKTEDAEGNVTITKEPIIEIDTLPVPIIKSVITRYETNTAGKLLTSLGGLVPIPGSESATGGLLAALASGLMVAETLRRKEKALKVENKDAKLKTQEKFEVIVGGIKKFMKTPEAKLLVDNGNSSDGPTAGALLLTNVSEKAVEYGIAKDFNKSVKEAKAVL